MILKDVHPDIERYLYEDCYCPGEIYDTTGFFFQVFKADEECVEVYRGIDFSKPDVTVITVTCRDQLINFWVRDDKVYFAERYDATENNIKIMPLALIGELPTGSKLDEFKPGDTAKALKEVFSVADAIII